MKGTFSILLIYCTVNSIFCNSTECILEDIKRGLRKLTSSSKTAAPQFLKDAVANLVLLSKDQYDVAVCKTCDNVVSEAIAYRKKGADDDEMKTFINELCNILTDWGTVACHGKVEIEHKTLLYIMDNKKNLTPARVCSIYLQNNNCIDPDANNWQIPLPPPPTYFRKHNRIENTDDYLKILQITDIHYDPLYVAGSNANCDEPLCCQSGTPTSLETAAGYWGDYNVCDMPRHSVENLFSRIKEKHLKDIDFVYYTGDIISHRSWATSKEDNTERIKEMYDWFEQLFGDKVVYPILGNHEPHPTDYFSPSDVTAESTQWIYNLSATEWSRWLPDDAIATVRRGGFYTVLVKPGFRIIALNSNVCYVANVWLIYEDEDPFQELSWLVSVLTEAEKNKERVHILSHIPPGEQSCHKQWSNQFRKIINRFASTISAQFNGHTHQDELKVFCDPKDNTSVINVAFNGASFTTYVANNPNYRIYTVNPASLHVENYDQYIYNLTEANRNSAVPPRWYKLYSFQEAYDLVDLSYESFKELLQKMSNDTKLKYQYFRFYVRDSDKMIKEGCDQKCLDQLFCYITAVETSMSAEC